MNAKINIYAQQRPIIENGDLVFITEGGSRELIGITTARRQLAEIRGKALKRPSTRAREKLLEDGIALFERFSHA